jgi:crossover junction endodeoxyribonuclease RusA
VLPLEFVVMGTPISAQGSSDAKRLWKDKVKAAGYVAAGSRPLPDIDAAVLRVAYFYVDAPAADLDNIVKPIQDALVGFAFTNDIQVVDLVASMRPKTGNDRIRMSPVLAEAFRGNSDFVHIVVDRSSRIEVLG